MPRTVHVTKDHLRRAARERGILKYEPWEIPKWFIGTHVRNKIVCEAMQIAAEEDFVFELKANRMSAIGNGKSFPIDRILILIIHSRRDYLVFRSCNIRFSKTMKSLKPFSFEAPGVPGRLHAKND